MKWFSQWSAVSLFLPVNSIEDVKYYGEILKKTLQVQSLCPINNKLMEIAAY